MPTLVAAGGMRATERARHPRSSHGPRPHLDHIMARAMCAHAMEESTDTMEGIMRVVLTCLPTPAPFSTSHGSLSSSAGGSPISSSASLALSLPRHRPAGARRRQPPAMPTLVAAGGMRATERARHPRSSHGPRPHLDHIMARAMCAHAMEESTDTMEGIMRVVLTCLPTPAPFSTSHGSLSSSAGGGGGSGGGGDDRISRLPGRAAL
ncbi:hypothetical protein OsJ_02464 [Oryza sativa Japonica Group]|uniref:Uncharacterized protein n=1 Tax=Oryza sativa subsp. japonica TaxID=39947 RepID=B9EXV6_ORYSJ|nr:hypothetical protein OsJ_02464 [Oryza sativa Japonica Group]